jgi:hypothetical protein
MPGPYLGVRSTGSCYPPGVGSELRIAYWLGTCGSRSVRLPRYRRAASRHSRTRRPRGFRCARSSWPGFAQDAVDCLEGVALLPSLAGHEPTLMRLWPAELTGAGVVGVYPASVADDVAAVAVRLATVCVEFGGCVHFVSPSVWATRPDLTPAGSGRAAIGCWVGLFPDHPLTLSGFASSPRPCTHFRMAGPPALTWVRPPYCWGHGIGAAMRRWCCAD